MISTIDQQPDPGGELSLQTIAMPTNTNAGGDIFGGWLVSQMDLAGSVHAGKIARGRIATVAIDRMSFMVPVQVGAIISCYTSTVSVGRSSIEINIEVWASYATEPERTKVTEGTFVFVAIDHNGRTRAVPKS